MKFTYAAAILSAVSAASLPYCPMPEPAAPAAPAPSAPAPAASSAPPSDGASTGEEIGLLTIHSGNVNVHMQAVGVNSDNKLGINASGGDATFVLEKGSADGKYQVKVKGTNNFLTLYSGYLETQPSAGNDFIVDGSDLVLDVPGNRGFIVCPSDGNTIKYSSDNCADPVGVSLYIAKGAN